MFNIVLLSIAIGQEPMLVEDTYNGGDPVGGKLAYQLREIIRNSQSMELTYATGTRFIMQLSSFATDDDNPSISTTYSVTYLIQVEGQLLPYYINGTFGSLGRDRVKEQAESIIASFDQLVASMMNSVAKYQK
jgi:hypothetical protein